MSKKLLVISGKKLISFPGGMNYKVARQRGSHVRLEKLTEAGTHKSYPVKYHGKKTFFFHMHLAI
jgi:predicted RNA binding protein YcfA (HicA-like mRNA interferase family)